MTLLSRSVSVCAAALLSGLAMAAAKPVSAADYEDNVFIATSTIGCGFFVKSISCFGYGGLLEGGPRPSKAGDTYTVHVQFEDRLHVPGSAVSNIFAVQVVDHTAVLGADGPGPYVSSGKLVMQGYEGPAAPFTTTVNLNTNFGYLAAGGFCCGYGVPNDGFSLTGAEAFIETLSDGPLDMVGYVAGFTSVLPATPEVLSNFQGGSPDSPVILPPGLTGQINGNIGGQYGADQFYGFTWEGGDFLTKASIFGAAPADAFSFKLFDNSGALLQNVYLGQSNAFTDLMSASLDAGLYKIGLTAWNPLDPAFSITFLTPVGSAVPEPGTWAMLIAGFGLMGAALRTRPKRRLSQALVSTEPPEPPSLAA